jgi:hypothetical protein
MLDFYIEGLSSFFPSFLFCFFFFFFVNLCGERN